MNTRLTHPKRTDPSLPDTSGWFRDQAQLQDPHSPRC
jgi:hypothetical protein